MPSLLAPALSLVAVLALSIGGPSASGSGWVWPVGGPTAAIVRPFEAPATRYAAGHRGVDLAAPPDAIVVAPADGVVAFAGVVAGRPVLALDHAGGYRSSVEPVASELAPGTAVRRGDPIGTVTAGGHCDGCLHFGVRLRGAYLDPRALVTGIPRAVLLPVP